ncbi:MAG: alpha/beta hydrolase [Actinomycetota bacterium]
MVAAVLAATALNLPGKASAAPMRYLEEVFTDVEVTEDVVYGAAVNDKGVFEKLKLDIYEPESDTETARPVFVWAHGGSMIGGDKAGSLDRDFANAFAKRGWVFVSINYRLMSQFFPDCPNDIVCALSPSLPQALIDGQHDFQAAVRWVRANAGTLKIDPDEITAGGHSAGTALALRTNFNPDDPGNSGNPGYPSHVAATMTNSGSLLEPTSIGPGAPPIAMFNSVDDADLTLWAGALNVCIPTTLLGNVCELHAFESGGHSLAVHRPLIIQKTAEFFCRRVLADCDVTAQDGTSFVGPTGSRWATNVECGTAPDDLLQMPLTLYAGTRGLEVCADGGLGPVQGRAYVDLGADGLPSSLQLDGDPDNPLYGGSIHLPANPVVIATELLDVIVGGLESIGVPLPM